MMNLTPSPSLTAEGLSKNPDLDPHRLSGVGHSASLHSPDDQ